MKIKFWQHEYEFDKEDAKIVVPLILLLIAISATDINKEILFLLAATYYFLYFFFFGIVGYIRSLFKRKLKCPKCKGNKIILQGYQPYNSDEFHAFYYCTDCKTTSILTEGGLTC